MSDRALLEAAARAAGEEIVGPVEKYIVQPNYEHIGGFIVRNDKGGDSAWNPLRDDGDALRLAVKLGMIVDMSGLHACEVRYYVGNEQFSRRLSELNDYRRAIVRAAAALGADK